MTLTAGHLFLAGFMGTGKTLIGAAVAQELGRPFYDLDWEIEKVAGKTIAEVFTGEGEPAFRKRESDTLTALIATDPAVIALGGGTPIAPANAALIARSGRTVLLTADEDTLWERLQDDRERPLLEGVKTRDEWTSRITDLLQKRREHYDAVADLTIDTSRRTVAEIAGEIVAWFESSR